MTNSEKKRAEAVIEEVFKKTSEEYLQLRIDEPIEKAAASFEFNRTAPVTHQTFNQVIRDFVRHVYQKALWGWQKMSAGEALTEAVAILERGYQAAHGQGYYTAFLDASNPNLNGLEYILTQMAGHITLMARARHIRWVCASRIELSGWPTRCLIAEILLQCWGPFLPENVRTCSPAQFAHHLPELINLVLSIDRTVSKMLEANIDFCDF
jgi:hypothetical protein